MGTDKGTKQPSSVVKNPIILAKAWNRPDVEATAAARTPQQYCGGWRNGRSTATVALKFQIFL